MIFLPANQEGFSGRDGRYFKLSPSVGIKVLHSKVFKNTNRAYKSKAFKFARMEVDLLNQAYETGIVPKCYGATLVKVKGGYRVGVLLQHLGTITIDKSEFCDLGNEVIEHIETVLEEVGIKHADLTEDNIMVYRKKVYVIDFSPDSIMTD